MEMNEAKDDIMKAKEWASADGKRRIEVESDNGAEQTIAVNDGKQMTMYDKASNTASIMKMNEEDIKLLSQQSPRQQAERLLKLIKDSHDLTVEGEEKIAIRDTYHIVAKAKDTKTLIGDIELWIDKETWMVLKSVSKSNQNVMTLEYTKIDYKPALEDDVFVLDIPEGTTVETVDENTYTPKEVTMEDAKETLGTFYKIPETDILKLASVTVDEGLNERQEFSFDYTKDGIPAFFVSVFKETASSVSFGGLEAEEDITIRGKKGTKIDSGDFRTLDWVEDGLRYSILLQNPEIGFEELEGYVEGMELVE